MQNRKTRRPDAARHWANKRGATWALRLSEQGELSEYWWVRALNNRSHRLPSPRGYYVYFLIGNRDTVLYVGQSANIYARLGAHMSEDHKFKIVDHVEFLSCKTRDHMDEAERELIKALRPPWNTVYNPDARS